MKNENKLCTYLIILRVFEHCKWLRKIQCVYNRKRKGNKNLKSVIDSQHYTIKTLLISNT